MNGFLGKSSLWKTNFECFFQVFLLTFLGVSVKSNVFPLHEHGSLRVDGEEKKVYTSCSLKEWKKISAALINLF